jgi:hypothetical protein
VLVGPPGTGKSQLVVGLGDAALRSGKRVRYFAAPALVETLYRGLADNSGGPMWASTKSAEALGVTRGLFVWVQKYGVPPGAEETSGPPG